MKVEMEKADSYPLFAKDLKPGDVVLTKNFPHTYLVLDVTSQVDNIPDLHRRVYMVRLNQDGVLTHFNRNNTYDKFRRVGAVVTVSEQQEKTS
jgi:hypothetical protein